MNKSQINKLRMFESVGLVLANHSALFATLQDLVNGLQRLQEGIRLIARYRQVQEINHSGLTETKPAICPRSRPKTSKMFLSRYRKC